MGARRRLRARGSTRGNWEYYQRPPGFRIAGVIRPTRPVTPFCAVFAFVIASANALESLAEVQLMV
jgi:hypothetical protein